MSEEYKTFRTRPLEFRAYNTSSKSMSDLNQITFGDGTWSVSKGRGVSLRYQPHIVVMQYTGIYVDDDPQVKLFEFDMVEYHSKYYLVVYNFNAFKLMNVAGVYYDIPTDYKNITNMGCMFDDETPFINFALKFREWFASKNK